MAEMITVTSRSTLESMMWPCGEQHINAMCCLIHYAAQLGAGLFFDSQTRKFYLQAEDEVLTIDDSSPQKIMSVVEVLGFLSEVETKRKKKTSATRA